MGAAEGTNPHKIRTIDLIFAVTVTACGALFFLVVMRSINGHAQSTWLVPLCGAAIYISLLSVFAVTVGIKKLLSPVIFISLLPSVILMPVMQHIIIVVFMYFILMYGLLVMRRTLFNLLKIEIKMIVQSGIFYVSFALIVIVTSQYYFFLQGNANHIFDASKYTRVVSMMMDTLLKKSHVEHVSFDTMTVDDFLFIVIKDATSEHDAVADGTLPKGENDILSRFTENMNLSVEKIQTDAKLQAVDSIKKTMSEKIGRDIQGNELASKVLSELIVAQLDGAIRANAMFNEHCAGFFAMCLFVVLLSLLPLIKLGAVILAWCEFMLMRELRMIRVTEVDRTTEVIAL